MHRYKQIEYKTGAAIEIIKCVPRGCRKGEHKRDRKTSEEIRNANMRQAARKLTRKINANFRPGDWHVVLTYGRGSKPSKEAAQKNIKRFLGCLRKEYRKCGFELKYIQVTEYLSKSIHHHVIINNINDGKVTSADLVRKLWKDKGNPKFVGLYDDGEYSRLADYFVKETEKTFRSAESPFRQRFSCSRNLINPKPECRIRTSRNGWAMNPKPRDGYYIDQDSLYNGTDKLGYPYQRYVMVKIHPEYSDWIPDCGVRVKAAAE